MTRIFYGNGSLMVDGIAPFPAKSLVAHLVDEHLDVKTIHGMRILRLRFDQINDGAGASFASTADVKAYLDREFARDNDDESRVSWSPPSASASWLIPHNLGRIPQVTVVDSAGETVGAPVRHLDSNTLLIEFGAPTGGTAHLS